jgi:NAD+ diphosphatase
MTDFKFCPRCAAPLTGRGSLKDIDIAVESSPLLVCSLACGFVHYDNPIPIVAVVVEYQGKVVLAHNRAWEQPFYGVITGFVDRGESPEQCAVREAKEELNLDAKPATLVGVYPSTAMNQIIIGYHVEATGEIALNEELDDFKLVSPEKCIAPNVGTGYVLRDWLRSKGIEAKMFTISMRKE